MRKCLWCYNTFLYADYCPKCLGEKIYVIDVGDEKTNAEVRKVKNES